MDSGTVKTVTDAVALLVPALIHLASIPSDQRSPDEALIRQLRVAAGALNSALMEVPRQLPAGRLRSVQEGTTLGAPPARAA